MLFCNGFSRAAAFVALIILALDVSLALTVKQPNVESLKVLSSWKEVKRNTSDQGYGITWHEEEGALHAVNRVVNLRGYFREGGFQLMPRRGDANWEWHFTLIHFGCRDELESVGNIVPRAKENHVRYQRSGITEWYVNREEGIEQGFIIHERSEGTGAVIIQGRISSNLETRLAPDAQSISFLREGQEQLRYGKLMVEDADGKLLPSHLDLKGDRLIIVIEEEGRYPIYVDPILTTPLWMAEINQEGACLGYSVSNAGDVNGDGYDDIIVGVMHYDNPEVDEGAAFVFYGCGEGCTEEGKNIVVNPVDSATGTNPATVKFDSVTVAGVTYLTIGDKGPKPPAGFRMCTPRTYYQITTTAVYTDSIEICIDYTE